MLEELVEHRVAIAVETGNIDLEVELTFHGKYAQGERHRMDRDLDGKISGSELATFVAGTTRRFAEGIRLKADGRELETFQLFNPEPDLLGMIGPVPIRSSCGCFTSPARLAFPSPGGSSNWRMGSGRRRRRYAPGGLAVGTACVWCPYTTPLQFVV